MTFYNALRKLVYGELLSIKNKETCVTVTFCETDPDNFMIHREGEFKAYNFNDKSFLTETDINGEWI